MQEIRKKYQVFVSSTFQDLQEERQEVMHALLELDCIPSGMELFPAANEDQWSLIKGVIDDCDYYILIVAGRYGSLGPKGLSYTEMEYRYALEKGKPIIAFLHNNPDIIAKNKSEKSQEGQNKLEDFRNFVQQKMCKFWSDAKDLGSVVSRSLISLQKNHPGIGWVRGNAISSTDAQIEILRLKQEIDKLKEHSTSKVSAPSGAENYAQGDDLISIGYSFKSTDKTGKEHPWVHSEVVSWNEIFYWILPLLMDEATDTMIKNILSEFLVDKCSKKYKKDKDIKEHTLHDFSINEKDYLTIIIQARALGLIEKVSKPKSSTFVIDRIWTLTIHGDEVMTQLRAIKKEKDDEDEEQ